MLKRALLFWLALAFPAFAAPVITQSPLTMLPGNQVGITGDGFGTAPDLYVATHGGTQIAVQVLQADANHITFQIPASQAFDVYSVKVSPDGGTTWSNIVTPNQPVVMQFEFPEVASGDVFRVWGRNLYPNSSLTPTVTFTDTATPFTQFTGTVNLATDPLLKAGSDPYYLTVTTPAGMTTGHTYTITVANSDGSGISTQTITARSATGTDYYGTGVPWGRDYIHQDGPTYFGSVDNSDHHVYNCKTDPFLATHCAGDGVTDDRPALQAAINAAAAHGGGLIYLPAGTYLLGSPTATFDILMASNVVVQGAGQANTSILFGPATAQASGYWNVGVAFPLSTTMMGFADLTLTDQDPYSQGFTNANGGQSSGRLSKIFFARVTWNTGTGLNVNLPYVDNLTVMNCIFNGLVSHQNSNNSNIGLFSITYNTYTRFVNNALNWYDGEGYHDIFSVNELVENNIFNRLPDQVLVTPQNINSSLAGDADAPLVLGRLANRVWARNMEFNEILGGIVQNNTFNGGIQANLSNYTPGVPLALNYNDGETINSEGGLTQSPVYGTGTVTSATASAITGTSPAWNYTAPSGLFPGSQIVMVSGANAGELRKITSFVTNTFNVTPNWTVTPSAGDNFSFFVPSLQNTLIRGNTAAGNPKGIILWGSADYNVSIIGNRLTDNGGIQMLTRQVQSGGFYSNGYMRNIEVIGNTIANTKQFNSAFIAIDSVMLSPTHNFGWTADGNRGPQQYYYSLPWDEEIRLSRRDANQLYELG